MFTNSDNRNVLNFQDIIILKQYIEKGFRENFFITQEIGAIKLIHDKLSNIIQQFWITIKDG